MFVSAAGQLAGRSRSRRAIPTRACARARRARRDRRGDRFEQLARARHGEARRERGAQPAVRRRRASACGCATLSSIDALRLFLQPRRHLRRRSPSCTCRSSRAGRSRPTASNTTSVSCTVSIVSTAVVPLAQQLGRRQPRRRAQRSRACAPLPSARRACAASPSAAGRRRSRGTASGRGGCASG